MGLKSGPLHSITSSITNMRRPESLRLSKMKKNGSSCLIFVTIFAILSERTVGFSKTAAFSSLYLRQPLQQTPSAFERGSCHMNNPLHESFSSIYGQKLSQQTPFSLQRLAPLYASTLDESTHSSTTTKTTTSHLSPSKLERLIVKLGRKGQTDQALQTYAQIPNKTVRQMNAAIDACARARPPRLEQAFTIFQNSKLKPNVYTFGALMSACARSGQVERAVQLLQTMQDEYGVQPNAVVYSTAVSACARVEPPRLNTALQLLEEAALQNLRMTVVGYNAAVSAAARSGDCNAAIQLLERMEDPEDDMAPAPDAVTYGTILSACEKAREWNQLLEYADRMQDNGHSLDGLAVTTILHACQQLGLANKALYYLDIMKTANSYQRRTAGWQVAGRRQPLRGPDAVAYRLTISACARGGAWQDGIKLLDEYCQNNATAPGDVVAYTAAITGCEYAGEWKQAFMLVERMRKSGVEPNEVTFAAVMGACATACAKEMSSGREDDDTMPLAYSKALRLLNALKKDPSTVDPNIQIYNAAIRVCAEALDLERAFRLLEDLREEGHEPNIITYGSLMTACERVGSIEGISKVFRILKQDGLEPNEIVYGAAISCCRKAGEAERAMLLLRKMIRDDLEPNVATFNTVLTAQIESKRRQDTEDALLVYKILKSSQYSAASPNRQTYNILIRGQAMNGQPREAEGLLRDMRDDGLVPDVDLYTATVSAYERAGQPLKALRLMESMTEDGYDFYEVDVLNAAFKKAVKLVNVVGGRWASNEEIDIGNGNLSSWVEDDLGDAYSGYNATYTG